MKIDLQRVTSLAISATCISAITWVLLMSTSSLDRHSVALSRDLVALKSKSYAAQFAARGDALKDQAALLADNPTLLSDMKTLSSLLRLLERSPRQAARTKPRVEAAQDQLTRNLEQLAEVTGVSEPLTVVNEVGVVLASTSNLLDVGQSLARWATQNANEKDSAADEPSTAPAPQGPVQKAVASGPQLFSKGVDGTLYDFAIAPIVATTGRAKRAMGALVVEREITLGASDTEEDMLVIVDGKIVSGERPSAAVSLASVTQHKKPFLWAKTNSGAVLPLVGPLPVGPLGVDRSSAGILAATFEIKGFPGARGVTYYDATPVYRQIATQQLQIVLLALALFVVHAIIILLGGRRMRRGVDALIGFLGKYHQGVVKDTKISEASLTPELVQLARLTTTVLEGNNHSSATVSEPAHPTLNDVLGAQDMPSTAELADLNFEGISDSGSIVPGTQQHFADEDDGEQQEELSSESKTSLADIPELPNELGDESKESDTPWLADAPANDHGALDLSDSDGTESDLQSLLGSDESSPSDLSEESLSLPEESAPSESSEESLSLPEEFAPSESSEESLSLPEEPPSEPEGFVFDTGLDGRSEPDSPAQDEHPDDALSLDAPASAEEPSDPLADHYKSVFVEFVQTRQQCGEDTARLTFEKFSKKLEKSAQAVIAKHGCGTVHFSVYVKDGKAALKAAPVQ